ncbi:tripartite motif-containing protein 16-like isoform X4 [Polypterus senegalus]|uniref:tripartite motif-containing protein 16-like isoform X4 n=1 Tax=Polypterus senegalus TaxID=55291 RepID=UPI0019631C9B|nr:tripartite motif-containing protein 16-like isoform X4 [Polypterus senegalus]
MKRLSVSILHKHRSLVTVCHSGSPFTMAAARPLLSADQFTCSVCLDVLKKPVTIPCGHNYCLDCINDYWDQSDTVEVYLCPQCRRSFNVRPELNRNTVLAEIIEKLNEMQSDVAPSQSYAGPDDVPCDVCPGRKWRAVKTCLTCMASYCESHLQPHREFEALKKHKLGDPTGNLEEKICEKHQRVLEIFCRTDETCVCLLCVATEHKSHDTVTPEEERAGRQSQLDKEKKGLRKRIQETEKRLVEIKESVVKIQKSAKKELQNHEDTFNFLTQIIQSLRSKVTETVRDHEQKEVRKAEELMEQLEKEIKKLKKTSAELAQLSHTDDHIHFLKKFPSLCVPMSDGVSPKLTANSDFLPETLKKDLSELQRHLQEMSGWEFVKSRQTVKTPSCFQQNMSRNSFLQYSCHLSMDPNTAHRRLQLTEWGAKVTCSETLTPYPDHPDRFDWWTQVLCKQPLSGSRFYWEIEWSGDGAEVGVAYKGISRKGKGKDCGLGSNDKSWSLLCSDSSWQNKKEKAEGHPPLSHRIGVYLDCPAGSLSIYRVSDTMSLLLRYRSTFTEPLYPGFRVRPNSSVKICPLDPSDQ